MCIRDRGKPCFRSNLISVSNKQVDFFFKMRDTLTCITSSRLEPVYFRKGAEEGDRYTVDEVWFSYKNGKCIADQRRMRRERDTVKSKDQSDECIFDMLSILMSCLLYTSVSGLQNLSPLYIRAMAETDDHTLWLGTANYGICKVINENELQTGYEKKYGMVENSVRSLLASSDGNLYVGYLSLIHI